jgi:hypothetical protein
MGGEKRQTANGRRWETNGEWQEMGDKRRMAGEKRQRVNGRRWEIKGESCT